MNNWKKYYDENMVSPEEATKFISSGDVVWLGNSITIPYALLDIVADRYEEMPNVTFISNMFLQPVKMLMDRKYKKSFRNLTCFPNVLERAAHKANLVEYLPVPYSYIPSAVTDVYKANVFISEVCEPDEDGYCNVGLLGTTFTPIIFKSKSIKKRIAVINKHQSPARGPEEVVKIHVSEFDAFCISDHVLPAIPPSEPEEIDEKIADQIMEYIHDGSSVQIGMGGLANAVGYKLAKYKDLTIYTEIVTDCVVDLVEKGAVSNIIAIGAFGMQPLYDFLATSDIVDLDTSEAIICANAVAKVENFVGINATLMADVTGQACSEAIGPLQYSSVGGQLDVVKGSNLGKNHGMGSVCFLALRSTYLDKEGIMRSNIVTEFPKASVVTTPRSEAMYFVTEYGVADVYLKSINDRVKAMISIAHPDFREELKKQAIAQGIVFEEDFQ
jgi:acyl-CoA hydrolase